MKKQPKVPFIFAERPKTQENRGKQRRKIMGSISKESLSKKDNKKKIEKKEEEKDDPKLRRLKKL